MKVLKFGGTSLGSAERMKKVASLIQEGTGRKIIVLSAVSGTTNSLVNIGESFSNKNYDEALALINDLHDSYIHFCNDLLSDKNLRSSAIEFIATEFLKVKELKDSFFNARLFKELLSKGEIISTRLFSLYLQSQDVKNELVSALDFMICNEDDEPNYEAIRYKLKKLVNEEKSSFIITQGFISRSHDGEISNLKRGGSDYSASIIASVLKAEVCEIWTDIDGLHNNDPRYVEHTFPIPELSFNEASELAYFGAKILHPATIIPAQKYNIPIRIRNTMDSSAIGTLISDKENLKGIKAIAAKDEITVIKIKSTRMLMAYGFLRKIFEVFEKYKTPIDMITTSEVAVSLSIDDNKYLSEIIDSLRKFGTVKVDKSQSIICAAGNFKNEDKAIFTKIIEALDELPIRMISYGGSDYNISLLLDTKFKKEALGKLNDALFLNLTYKGKK